jgi:prepilin-type processing-associated H-X9-DG protein
MTEITTPPAYLQPMEPDYYDDWRQGLIVGYADGHVKAGNWPADGSLERSEREIESLLPKGLQTEGHYLFTIVRKETNEKVGYLWFNVTERSGEKVGFIFDLEIDERHRRKGYARAAMLALEEKARSLGIARLGLHVFAYNTAAKTLYESLGFSVTGHSMTRQL